MQAFALNIRRDKFRDPRVRRAFNFAFDFEEMNKQMFFGQYKRISSYFDGTELASTGLPQGRNWKSSRPCAPRCPPRCSRRPTPIRSAAIRKRCATICARRCAAEGGRLRGARPQAGRYQDRHAVRVRIAGQDPSFERVMLFYKPSLERLGITVSVRTIDPTQYENRLRSWDFDIVMAILGRVAVAGQRAARILGLAGGRHARARAISSASRIRRSTS